MLFFLKGKTQSVSNYSVSHITDTSTKSLFESDQILNITLKGNIRQLLNDRSGNAKYFPFTLSYTEDSTEASIPVTVKTRGHFRREKTNCSYPPLLLNIPGTAASSVFPTHSKLKLVMPCRGEEYIVHEWLVYKLYNLITQQSFRTRLVKVKLEDLKNKKMSSPFYAIILEEENQMAQRNNCVLIKKKIIPQETMRDAFLKMAVFEYLIGNTDWSVEYRQNIKLIAHDTTSSPIAVPYDFDLSGIVDAPYAKPAPELKMNSVRDRRFRGYCIQDMKIFDSTIAFYNRLKNEIYNVFTGCSILKNAYVAETVKYLDKFYSTINNPVELKKEFGYPCLKYGTGNVIIKGLKEE